MVNLRNINLTLQLNDNGDFLVQIKATPEFIRRRRKEIILIDDDDEDDKVKGNESIFNCSLFYFLPAKDSDYEEFIYYDSKSDDIYDLKGCSLNENFIFFWNLGVVWSLELKTK